MSEVPLLLSRRRGLVMGISGENSIGFHCARLMNAMGAQVAVTYRPARRETCAPLCDRERFVHETADVDDESSVARAVDACGRATGGLDFLLHTVVHVPEGLLQKPLLDVKREDLNTVLDVGVHSLVVLCRHAMPLLAQSSAPRVVTLTSASDHLMTPNYHVAGIAKAALAATVLYLAQELGPKGVLVNAVSCSLLATDGAVKAVGKDAAAATRNVLARKAATRKPVEFSDVANAVAWLCSAACTNVTAEVLDVDGGFSRNYF